MTRLARRNRSRWIKLWKQRGYEYLRGALWERLTFRTVLVGLNRAGADFESAWANLTPTIWDEIHNDAT